MDAAILGIIERADLSAVEYRAARRLLDRVSDQWTVFLDRDAACAVCGVTTWAAARRILARLQEAGVATVHTNNCAYVTFCRAETDHQRAETARPAAAEPLEPRQNGSQARQNGAIRAETDHRRAVLAHLPKDQDQERRGRKIDPILSSPALEGGAGETAPKRIDPDEQARSVAMLTDPKVGLYLRLAEQTAERFGFVEIAAQVFRYLRDRAAGKVRSPGCIPQRLARAGQFAAEMEIGDYEHPLWLRYASEAEAGLQSQAIRRKYIPDELSDIILG